VVEELADLLASTGVERPRATELVDKEAVALVGRDAPGTGVGLSEGDPSRSRAAISERTVAEDTLTPGASTTCWDPTGWAEPMYSVTTALRMAALRASRSSSSGTECSVL